MKNLPSIVSFFFFQAEDVIGGLTVTGVQACALPISSAAARSAAARSRRGRTRSRAGSCCGSARTPRGAAGRDRKSVVEGKSVDLGGRRIIKKKKFTSSKASDCNTVDHSMSKDVN